MALTINTNIASLNAQRNLSTSQLDLNTSMQRLSSGLRINSAKDDAAGLAITDRMTAQIRGLNQASRNANDGISMAQTAEGALQESTNILQRIRELAVQSANDTNSSSDRESLNQEVQQLKSELDRIAATTEFNGRKVIDGTMDNATFQVGPNAGEQQTISFAIDGALATDLSQVGTTIDEPNGTPVSSFSMAGTIAEGDLLINEVAIGDATTNAELATAINNTETNITATVTNAQTFNFDEARLGSVNEIGGSTLVTSGSAGVESTLTTNGITVTAGNVGVVGDGVSIEVVHGAPVVEEQQDVVFGDLLNGETTIIDGVTITSTGGHTAAEVATVFNGGTVAGLALTNALSGDFTYAAHPTDTDTLVATATTGTAMAELTDTGTNSDNTVATESRAFVAADATGVAGAGTDALVVTIADADWATSDASDVAALLNGVATASAGNLVAIGDTTTATVVPSINLANGEDTSNGELTLTALTDANVQTITDTGILLNGTALTINLSGIDATDPIGDLATAITASDAAVTAVNNGDGTITITSTTAALSTDANGALQDVTTTGSVALDIDGNTVDLTTASSDGRVSAQDMVDAIGTDDTTGLVGYSAALDSDTGELTITKTDGTDMVITETITGSTDTGLTALDGTDVTASTYTGQVLLDSEFDIVIEEVTDGALANAGLTQTTTIDGETITETVGNATTTIDLVDISTREGAWIAIASADEALMDIDEIRGGLGAVQNRFLSTISNLDNVAENLSAARSRILDADIAMETSAMTKNNILQQAGVSILSQANQTPQLALSLLQG